MAKRKFTEEQKRQRFGATLKQRYGITLDFYDALLEEQGYACALCEKPVSEMTYRICVDHVHGMRGEDAVRGLLCRPCNASIGMLGDTVEGLLKAIQYLNKYNEGNL